MARACPWTKSNLNLQGLTKDYFCLFYLKKARQVTIQNCGIFNV